jgi:hypothetical protein
MRDQVAFLFRQRAVIETRSEILVISLGALLWASVPHHLGYFDPIEGSKHSDKVE